MVANVDGFNINYEISGNGEDLLFLHGWGSSLDAFTRMITPLKENFRCIALDLPGFGDSDLLSSPLNLQDYCNIVKKFIETLGLNNPIMIGHSNGARIIMKMCADKMVAPKKIVLFGAAGLKKKPTFKKKIRLISYKIIKGILTLPLIKCFTKEMLEAARSYYGSADYNAAPPVMRQTLVNLVNVDLSDDLHKITASTLLVWGENDSETPIEFANIINKKIKDCGICVIKGGTHWCFLENPAQVDLILSSFLEVKNE